MNLIKKLSIFISIILINSCAEYKTTNISKAKAKQYYSSFGFALIYEDKLYLEKVINKKFKNNNDIIVMHNFLKRNTPVRITNPDTTKSIETIVNKRAKFPQLFNVVISKKLATSLELDFNNPYIEINEIKKNKKFIAKKSNTFDEEKNVAGKAPVDEVKMDSLSDNSILTNKKEKKYKNFILAISDFYYLESANNLKSELSKKMKMNNFYVKKINNNKYRLLIGPFKNFNALKTTYISLNQLGFEGLNIYRE